MSIPAGNSARCMSSAIVRRKPTAANCWCIKTRKAWRWGLIHSCTAAQKHTDIMKTEGLKQALNKYGFDAAFGGARRDEEKSRAKERIYSFRDRFHRWDPKISARSCGTTTTGKLTKAKASASSRSLTGPSRISGNTSGWKISTLFRYISLRNVRFWNATVC